MKEKTLKKFLKQHRACEGGYKFAKDLTLSQFLKTCPRGDWILWLFARMNPDNLRELTLAKGYCANTVRNLMTDQRSLDAVDAAIAFGKKRIGRKKLDAAAADAYAAAYAAYADAAAYAAYAAAAYADAAAYAAYADAAAYAAYAAAAAYAAYAAAADAYAAAAYARKEDQKKTADICRKYLPLKIWDQSKL